MKIVLGVLFAIGIAWSLVELIAAFGLPPAADAEPEDAQRNGVAPASIELVREIYADCPAMRSLVARYDAGDYITALALLDASIRCDERSSQPQPIVP